MATAKKSSSAAPEKKETKAKVVKTKEVKAKVLKAEPKKEEGKTSKKAALNPAASWPFPTGSRP